MNHFAITGYIGKDLEQVTTPSGADLVKAVVGVKEFYDGEEKTHWIDLTLWGKLGINFAAVCGKGDFVLVSGKITKRTWKDRDNNPRATYEFIGLHWELLRRTGEAVAQPEPSESKYAF